MTGFRKRKQESPSHRVTESPSHRLQRSALNRCLLGSLRLATYPVPKSWECGAVINIFPRSRPHIHYLVQFVSLVAPSKGASPILGFQNAWEVQERRKWAVREILEKERQDCSELRLVGLGTWQ